jgi:L-arabinokinase
MEACERDEFLEEVRRAVAPSGPLPEFFDPAHPVAVARAPGRLDVLGGIADYSGSLVLQWPIREAAFVAAQSQLEPWVHVVSLAGGGAGAPRRARVPIAVLLGGYESARVWFAAHPDAVWAGYAAGVVTALAAESNVPFAGGVRLLIASRVPEGKGVSSSAALEVASLYAIARAKEVPLDPHAAALLCQRVENLVVGAPCGVMDQMTASCGKRGHLLELLCQPATIQGQRGVPEDLAFFGIDSGVSHAVTGADYARVRVAAFMGYRILADALGFTVSAGEAPGRVHIDDPRWKGYLANVTPSEIQGGLEPALPSHMTGAEFLRRYGGTTDAVTPIVAEHSYPIRAATLHPIFEHHRVRTFCELLSAAPSGRGRALLGELFYQSHASYSACGLGTEATDRLVAMVLAAGSEAGLFGAKITGGGSGGTVAIVARADAEPGVGRIAARYRLETGRPAFVFSGSSAGAAEFGTSLHAL